MPARQAHPPAVNGIHAGEPPAAKVMDKRLVIAASTRGGRPPPIM